MSSLSSKTFPSFFLFHLFSLFPFIFSFIQLNRALTDFRGPTIFLYYMRTSVIANKRNKKNQLDESMNLHLLWGNSIGGGSVRAGFNCIFSFFQKCPHISVTGAVRQSVDQPSDVLKLQEACICHNKDLILSIIFTFPLLIYHWMMSREGISQALLCSRARNSIICITPYVFRPSSPSVLNN